jgi:hypothetical protein
VKAPAKESAAVKESETEEATAKAPAKGWATDERSERAPL